MTPEGYSQEEVSRATRVFLDVESRVEIVDDLEDSSWVDEIINEHMPVFGIRESSLRRSDMTTPNSRVRALVQMMAVDAALVATGRG